MLTSAPFDDWWHNAYGLDVRIESPPHILLGLGMMGIVLGALLRTLALQNASEGATRRRAATLFAVSSGFFVAILAILLLDSSYRTAMHSGGFYIALSRVLPVLLVAVAVAGGGRWPATAAATVYMLLMAGTSWVLMLFPATPKLGPIYRDITHYVPLDFPLLLVVPAAALDLTWRRVRDGPRGSPRSRSARRSSSPSSPCSGRSRTLHRAIGRNWFLHADNFVYWQRPETEHFNFEFDDADRVRRVSSRDSRGRSSSP